MGFRQPLSPCLGNNPKRPHPKAQQGRLRPLESRGTTCGGRKRRPAPRDGSPGTQPRMGQPRMGQPRLQPPSLTASLAV